MKAIDYILSLPKSLIFNLSYFGIKGLKLPVIISHRTYLKKMSGTVIISNTIKTGGIRIGFGDVPAFDKKRSRSIFFNEGTIVFSGRAKVGHGGKLVVCKGGRLNLGNRFNLSAESLIYCTKSITFGDYNLISWGVQVIDSDLHDIYSKGNIGLPINPPKAIKTENSVWLCARSNILKGSYIPSHSIIASNANVCGVLDSTHSIYGGNPAKLIKQGIAWDSAARDYKYDS
ncbi:transferase [Salinivibrio sp. ML323]|uniref:acyltransferase n=1 Tax=unclassified Salinivibrio TaxID=2636825 RepID=UPI0009879F67|nr:MULTISPECIES: transferase [unclassified Salinivibrio]OOE58601.1 transferase [Salinivibrio sp. ML323]OOE66165.1 transferase [Salinivibrio sp. IB282]